MAFVILYRMRNYMRRCFAMPKEEYSRSELLLGSGAAEKLARKKIILFGLGGVGSYAAEALARAGIGHITVVDNDCVSVSNLNRQLCALHSTIGKTKAEVIAERIKDINPRCEITAVCKFCLPENIDEFELEKYDYIADAIDTVSAKIALAEKAFQSGIPIISCMGTGNKYDPSRFKISDISKTSVCPLCRVMRCELKKRGVKKLNVVWSDEEPAKVSAGCENGRHSPGSLPFVPGAAGLIMAGRIILDLNCEEKQ